MTTDVDRDSSMVTRQLTRAPVAKTGMLIRKPVAEVFEAFVDPRLTTQFWFTKASGRLDAGTPVQWEWEMYGVSITVTPKVIEPNRRIVVEWPGYSGLTTIEWTFTPRPDGTTYVRIVNSGFTGDGDAIASQLVDSTQGFTFVLAGLKAFLEQGVRLNLIADAHPAGLDA